MPRLAPPLVVAVGVLLAPGAHAQEPARGVVVDPVRCTDDAAQSYALYLPSTYTPERPWTLLLAFHPAARGRVMVETYRAAAERHGVIVAGSNNARNGPHAISAAAAQAMAADVSRRFSIDGARVYLTGMSGGARVALGLALANEAIAGVIASSAGFPDSQPRERVRFPLFSTAGTDDFNYIELRQLDRALKSPHFLAVFEGGHTVPPEGVALDAIEWMELQAMRAKRRAYDDALVRRMLDRRRAAIAASTSMPETVYLLQAVVADFADLLDVSAESKRLDALMGQSDVKAALKRAREMDDAESKTLEDILAIEAGLADPDRRVSALTTLRARLAALARRASGEADTAERRQARRVLRALAAASRAGTPDREYLALLEQHRVSIP